ncbi:hypothetical protein OG333_37250 (plasmid) [Streptomyces anulatus]|uniref:hypothetical protein n=1 Tax=Streptomyces anulatus TaxID=1892 RepID=UPI002F90C539|nr:hypothetical protein OG333_36955 [Streptomyces anulatus]WSV80067.1 hypothetical protein OG333_37250 [Streptomyces anulatus]
MHEEPLPENPGTPESKKSAPPAPVNIRTGDDVQGTVVIGNHNSAAMFIAGATLLPFLQALWGVMGTRIGERLDDTARGALRRILRRELEQGRARGNSPAPRLLTTPGGTQIRLDADMPEEALPHLLDMVFERLEEGDPDAPALVRWTPAGWLATVARSGQLYDLSWDSQRSDWVRLPASPTP